MPTHEPDAVVFHVFVLAGVSCTVAFFTPLIGTHFNLPFVLLVLARLES